MVARHPLVDDGRVVDVLVAIDNLDRLVDVRRAAVLVRQALASRPAG
jgi:hypothetical protein